jgi:hypothetical protein
VRVLLRAVGIGTIANTAQVRPAERDVNPADNTDSALVRVIGLFRPPAVTRCDSLTVTPRVLRAGETTIAVATARDHRGHPLPGVSVKARGNGVEKSTTTDAKGRARFTLTPKAGLVLISALGQRTLLLRPRHRCATLVAAVASGNQPSVTG